MRQVNASDVLFFFGAGASAPFGIPTMKQFVLDFEKYLHGNATDSEQKIYSGIKQTLEKRLSEPVDLEAVFTVIDGIINYNQEKLGLLSLYSATKFREPNIHDKATCKSLRGKFKNFVREKCEIPEESYDKIKVVYQDFFNRFALEFGGQNIEAVSDFWFQRDWSIFTTNYDTCLEYYWWNATGIGVNTGFDHDKRMNKMVLNPRKLLQENIGIQLFKLHGSITWFIEKGTDTVIEVTQKGRSYVGREYVGEMMVYPIAEKELYLDPYISMLLRLNRELEKKSVWIVIGYSFNDPIIREIFLKKSNNKKHLILVRPEARKVISRKLQGIEGKLSTMEKKFGLSKQEEIAYGEEKQEQYKKVNHQIISKLKDNPRFKWSDRVVPT